MKCSKIVIGVSLLIASGILFYFNYTMVDSVHEEQRMLLIQEVENCGLGGSYYLEGKS